MTLRRVGPLDPALPAVLALVQTSFAYMNGVIDPASSMLRLTLSDVKAQSQCAEIWVIGDVKACIFLTPKTDTLYVGKLAVSLQERGRGHARTLIDCAADRARVLGLPALELQVRIELTANQAAFAAMGFVELARTAHPGYDRPTSITYRRPVAKGQP